MRSKVLTTIRCHQAIGLMLFFVVALSGCASHEESPEPVVIEAPKEPEPMSLLLACAPVSSDKALTRLENDVVQLNGSASYRDITNVRVFAIKEDAPVNATVDHRELSDLKTDKTQFYHFSYCSMPTLTNGCLVYAKALDENQGSQEATSRYNGSLNANIPDQVQSFDDIQFSLESILDATEARESGDDRAPWEIEAWTLAKALTDVVDESHNEDNTLVWKTSTNVILRNLFQRFTNNGADLPGSAASVKQWMLALRAAANSYLENPPTSLGNDDKALLAIIMAKAEAAAADDDIKVDYPRDINLPDGAAVLRWIEVKEQDGENIVKVQKFVPQLQTTTLDNINSVSRFVYPPALYYFVESGLKTSNTSVMFDEGEEGHGYSYDTSWSTVLGRFNSGSVVSSDTKSIAVVDPLQYAVAHLTMEVKANARFLKYDESENTINIDQLTLKGVIIGGQRSVNYEFKPISNSQYDVNFVYDSQVNSGNTTLKYSSESETGDIYHTLVLQSYDGENVNIILEFEYSGNTGFKCLNGYVYPGTRFYLVGEVKANNFKYGTGDATSLGRVFTQDYTTTIEMTVQSLEKAYNVLPSLLSSSLEIGVMITPQWFSAMPSDPVVMD